MKFALIIFTIAGLICHGGNKARAQKVFTEDIDHFWTAYDSIQKTPDSLQQVEIIKSLYIKKGTPGLKAFMLAREYSAGLWVKLIRNYPKFWQSIRPNTLAVQTKSKEIEASIIKFQQLYPELKEAKMYFTIGGLRSGGTTVGNMVLVGAEIACGDPSTDVSEFPNDWLAGVFKEQSLNNIINLNIHEYVHTQQKGEGDNLLAACIHEGACDFITELVIEKQMAANYIKYGLAHEESLKASFKNEMFGPAFSNWLYNGSKAKTVADLGYFMGYAICKSYYKNAADKQKAIKEIIELNLSKSEAVEHFLLQSKYYTEPIDKAALIKAYESKRPFVVSLSPFNHNDTLVDASLTDMQIQFSDPMDAGSYSFSKGKKGSNYPLADVAGFTNNNTTLTLKVKLQPNQLYEFIITKRSFQSAEGYPLKQDYPVQFRTR